MSRIRSLPFFFGFGLGLSFFLKRERDGKCKRDGKNGTSVPVTIPDKWSLVLC